MGTRSWAGPLLVGAIVIVGCGGDDDSSAAGATVAATAPTSPGSVASTSASPAEPGAGAFTDSFDDDRNGWGTIDDAEYGTATFAAGDYVWSARGSIVHWLPEVIGEAYDRGDLDALDVIVRAEATIDAGGGVIGVFCRETPDTDAEWQWYEFVARDGYAAIRLADLEGNLEALAETNEVSLPLGEPMVIEGTCVDADGVAQLSLALNGADVLQASHDEPLGNGAVGLQMWTFPVHEQMDVRWHEFSYANTSA